MKLLHHLVKYYTSIQQYNINTLKSVRIITVTDHKILLIKKYMDAFYGTVIKTIKQIWLVFKMFNYNCFNKLFFIK